MRGPSGARSSRRGESNVSERGILGLLHRFGYVVAMGAVAIATLVFMPLRAGLDFAHLAWFYLVVVAWSPGAGTGPAVLTAVLSFFSATSF